MNAQVLQLFRQAGGTVSITEHETGCEILTYTDHFDVEKFAKLIVLECMHECLRMQLGNQYTPEELLFQTKYRKIIKEHFGVEE
jgi:hypothetical protein